MTARHRKSDSPSPCPLLGAAHIEGDVESFLRTCGTLFWEFHDSDSGCRSVGIESKESRGVRWFVKFAQADRPFQSLAQAAELNRVAQHPTLPPLRNAIRVPHGLALVYEWVPGVMIRSDDHRKRFSELLLAEQLAAVNAIFDLHLMLADLSFIAVDLYDGCFLYDFDGRRIYVCDLDEYRRGPFRLDADRLPGSTRFMAPAEFVRGSMIDQATNVFALGRTAAILLGNREGTSNAWRGSAAMWAIIEQATQPERSRRFQSVREFVHAWRAVATAAIPTPEGPGTP